MPSRGRPRAKKGGLTIAVTPRGRKGRKSTGVTKSSTRTVKPWEAEEEDQAAVDYVSDEEEDDDAFDSLTKHPVLDFDDVEEDFDPTSVGDIKEEMDLSSDGYNMCPWVELPPGEIPLLELPSSSQDLILPSNLLMSALELYELCRTFYRTIGLTPFLFEDLCAALMSNDQSSLLAEIHISLLKVALRDDEEEQVTFSVTDTNNSFNIILQLLEPMTYGEVLRQYGECDPRTPPKVVDILSTKNYPFVEANDRISVILWLCDRFLHSVEFKKLIKNDGKVMSEDKCRECNKGGDTLPCDTCECVFHLECAGLTDVPEGHWQCRLCEKNAVRGVSDCPPLEQGNGLRMSPIGVDRHGRSYWFCSRRIFVHDSSCEEVSYYSTAPQLHELLARLDPDRFEAALCRFIRDHVHVIVEQMAVTVSLTQERRDALALAMPTTHIQTPFLALDNLNRICEILSECREKEKMKEEEDADELDHEGEHVIDFLEREMGIHKGHLQNTFWSAGAHDAEVMAHRQAKESTKADDTSNGFKMGEMEKVYNQYRNEFNNEYAKPHALRIKERDRRKYMCGRFALAEEGHFEWSLAKGKDLFSSETAVARFIEWTILRMARRIPTELMHRLWSSKESQFREMLNTALSVDRLRDGLLWLECGMRKTLFLPQWWNSLGHTRLYRTTTEMREHKQREEAKKKKLERELVIADQDDDSIVWVKYTKLLPSQRHTVWRMKDEQYRVNGREVLGGWIWIASTFTRTTNTPPKAPNPLTTEGPWRRKANRVDGIASRLLADREEEEEREGPGGCFAPSCQQGPYSCYSTQCRRKERIEAKKKNTDKKIEEKRKKDKELGGEKPFPLPTPLQFLDRANKKRSILILEQRYLRRLARQGGLSAALYFPGFSRSAKANFQCWNYPCPRPLFDHCWRWLTRNARSLHAVALQLRILWASVRWSDLVPGDEKEKEIVVHLPDHDEKRTVIGHREMPPDGLYERYELSVKMVSIDDSMEYVGMADEDESETYSPARRGIQSRKRKATMKKLASTSRKGDVKEKKVWIDGVELKLWEIREYWARVRKAQEPVRPRETPALTDRPRPQYHQSFVTVHAPSRRFSSNGRPSPTPQIYRRQTDHQYDDYNTSIRRTAGGRDFPQGNIRGGGKFTTVIQTQADGSKKRVVLCSPGTPTGVVMARINQQQSFDDEPPPVIPRYDSPTAQPSSSQTARPAPPRGAYAVRVNGGKVLMIRRPDGSTQLLRPVAAEEGVPRHVGGRVVRVAPPPAGMRSEDPFMRRMAVEKAQSGTPVLGQPSLVPRRGSYASYYGSGSNEAIDVDEYQALAEQGYRPPGRPPGRLAAGFPHKVPRVIPRTSVYGNQMMSSTPPRK